MTMSLADKIWKKFNKLYLPSENLQAIFTSVTFSGTNHLESWWMHTEDSLAESNYIHSIFTFPAVYQILTT